MMLDPKDYINDPGDHLATAFPGSLQLQQLPSGLDWAVQPELAIQLQ
jgi:hypothetical protein